MIKMKISSAEALRHLKLISHATCRKGISTRWRVEKDQNGNDFAKAQSICWLFCWAKTGRNSEQARAEAHQAFDAIFDQSFNWLDQKLGHNLAREWRYEKGGIESDFYSQIGRK